MGQTRCYPWGDLSDVRQRRRATVIERIRRAVRTTGKASLCAGAQRFLDDGLDGTRATATFGAATEAPIDLLGVAGKTVRAAYRAADIVVGQDVAGTNDHEKGRPVWLVA
jgi:hypothetical protein